MEIAGPHFEINETVEPTPDAAIEPAGPGRVESRAWTEFRGQPGYWRYTIRWPGGTSSESAKHLQPADRIACDLKVVVSGAPFKIETYTTQTVGEVVEVALAKAGIPHPDTPANPTWQLRTEDGRELRHLVGEAELVDGVTILFLDPEVGGGGNVGMPRPADDPSHMRRQAFGSGEESHAASPGEKGEVGISCPGSEGVRGPTEIRREIVEIPPEARQGTPPAEGTRRKLILDTIEEFGGRLGYGGAAFVDRALELADAIEAALNEEGFEAFAFTPIPGKGRTRALEARDRLPRAVEIEAIGWISAELAARSGAWDGKAPSWFPEPPEWIELWDKALAAVERRCGRCGEPLNPKGGCPNEFDHLLVAEGVPAISKHDSAETADESPGGDDPAATIKFLEAEVERLLGHCEEARSGESRFAEERDCAFALLRWLLPVTVAKRID